MERLFALSSLKTSDFRHFKFEHVLGAGRSATKAWRVPRKINGLYAMLGRQVYANLYLMYSDHLHFAANKQLLWGGSFPWEFIQMGNCGSPIKTEAGWLVLEASAAGPLLLVLHWRISVDLEDPAKLIGRLPNRNRAQRKLNAKRPCPPTWFTPAEICSMGGESLFPMRCLTTPQHLP